MTEEFWVVEIDANDVIWSPIAYCFTRKSAESIRDAAHIRDFGRPVRIREYGKAAEGETV